MPTKQQILCSEMKHIVQAQYNFSTTYEFGDSESKERDKEDKIFPVLNLLGTSS
jgi:hypothetical protein